MKLFLASLLLLGNLASIAFAMEAPPAMPLIAGANADEQADQQIRYNKKRSIEMTLAYVLSSNEPTQSGNHSLVKKVNKKAICPVCNKKFSEAYELKKHTKRLHQDKPYQCSHQDCKKTFLTQEKLDQHSAVRHNEKTWACTICSYCSMRKYDLQIHMKSHRPTTKAKSIQCAQCREDFLDSNELKTHILQAHDGRFTCELCSIEYSSAFPLARHMQSHDERNQLKCTHCDYATFRQDALKRHQRIMHHDENSVTVEAKD